MSKQTDTKTTREDPKQAVATAQWFNDPDILGLAEDVYETCKRLASEERKQITAGQDSAE